MVERFIDNDFLWNKVSSDPVLMKKAMQSYMENRILNHPFLKEDAYMCKTEEGLTSVVIIDRMPIPCIITEKNFDLIRKIFDNNPGGTIRTALVLEIPTFDHFVRAGGKRQRVTEPYQHYVYSGETKEIWTIGGRFKGRACPDDPKRVEWIQWEDKE